MLKGIKLRFKGYIKKVILEAIYSSFGDVKVFLFGSRIDDSKKGGDFDLAIMGDFSKEEFRKRKIEFIKIMIKKDLDLPIDLVNFKYADELLQKEINNKGILLYG